MQRIERRPHEQVQTEQRSELIKGTGEMIRRQAPEQEQRKPAPQIPEQSGAQTVGLDGTRGQLRRLRSF
jgi:hypothetical protein